MNLKGTHTEGNLKKAMQGEALAYIKYQIYASLIGEISKDMEEKINHIAHNEKEHFKIWKKFLLEQDYYDNVKNLIDAMTGEIKECEEMYPEFARIAREEGFNDIAEKFEQVGAIECHHSWLFDAFLDRISNKKSEGKDKGFICLNCGYIHRKKVAPDVCPVCDHPKKYFTSV